MNKNDLVDFLSSIGSSGTRREKENLPELIGQFGIGFLSAFVVAGFVEVRTRKFGENEGWLWSNSGSKTYTLKPCEVEQPGTTVLVQLKSAEDKGVIHDETVRSVVQEYADMLLVPIFVNGSETPENRMHMPWEKRGARPEQLKIDCFLYLERTMRDSVLEAIPVDLGGDVKASGVLYITRTRTFHIQAPRTVRVFQNRMFLCENADILPRWATFINGVLNTPDLTPTAARDNFIRDGKLDELRKALGDLIIRHLEELQKADPHRFSKILQYQHFAIKAACHYYDPFFQKFAHLLQWRTNGGELDIHRGTYEERWRTLPEILREARSDEDGRKLLPCFSTSNSAYQYFRMADGVGSTVVDASYPFESQLIETYAKLIDPSIKIVHVDRDDDESVFRPLKEDEAALVQRLADVMSEVLRPVGHARVRVEARRFEPEDLAAVLRTSDRSKAQNKAADILTDPNAPEDLREMAREMARLAQNASMKLTINAANDLVQRLSRQDLSDPDVTSIMSGVYNNAIIANQELMTSTNAHIFAKQFHAFMSRNLNYIEEKRQLQAERAVLQRERVALAEGGPEPPRHSVIFMMTPFSDGYKELIKILRELIEDEWQCQFILASDHIFEDRIFDNVRSHIGRAHAFVAEVTEANPNVMFELGAVQYNLCDRPVLLLRRNGADRAFPADLHGYIYVEYEEGDFALLRDTFRQKLRRVERLQRMFDAPDRELFISHRILAKRAGSISISNKVLCELETKYPTQQSWRRCTVEDLSTYLGGDRDVAEILLRRFAI